jgi:hypothetical protein
MKRYIAWLGKDGIFDSVATGTVKECEQKAREIYASPLYQQFSKERNVLRITSDGKQLFVKAIEL